jgi:hypothetical protein
MDAGHEAVTRGNDHMMGLAVEAIDRKGAGNLLDTHGGGTVDNPRNEVLADRNGIVPIWRLDRPANFARTGKTLIPTYRGHCALAPELVDSGAQKAHLGTPIWNRAQRIGRDRPAYVDRDRLAPEPQEFRGQGQEPEFLSDQRRNIVAQPVSPRKPDRHQQRIMVACDTDEGVGPAPVGDCAGHLQFGREGRPTGTTSPGRK